MRFKNISVLSAGTSWNKYLKSFFVWKIDVARNRIQFSWSESASP